MRFNSSFSALALTVMLASGWSTPASAYTYQRCPSCTTTQMNTAARSLGAGTWIVWNPTNGNTRKYDVTCGVVNGIDPAAHASTSDASVDSVAPQTDATCTAIETMVPQGVLDVAAALYQLSQLTNGTYATQLEVHASDWNIGGVTAPTAHDYVTNFNYRSQLNDYLGDSALSHTPNAASSVLEYLSAHIDATLSFTDSVQITIDLLFQDGSKVKVKLKLDTSADYVPGSARDSSGQAIPDENASQYAGTWHYGSGDANAARMTDTLRKLGAEVIVGQHQYGFLTCFWQQSGHSLTCHWSQY